MREASTDPLLGITVQSYRIARKIGQGGMGQVYRAVHPAIGSRVAVKVLSYECAAQPTLVERFFAEARAVNMIRHEHIVNVLDLARLQDGRPFIVMEYLDGQPLSEVIRGQGPLKLTQTVDILLEVLAALGAAHDKGIVHRDLKPDNIFISPAGHAKVLDFGIAKLLPMADTGDGTKTGSLLGTPHYMSPEQAMGRTADHRSDLYSVGVILYEAVTGRRPFDATTLYALLKQQVESDPAPPSTFRHNLPPALQSVMARSLAKDPAQRFQDARQFANELRQLRESLPKETAGEPGAAPHTGSPSLSSSAHGPTPWSAPSIATGIRAPGQAIAHTPATPSGSYVQDQSIAHAAKSRGSMVALFAVGCLGIGVIGAIAIGALFFLGSDDLGNQSRAPIRNDAAGDESQSTTGSSEEENTEAPATTDTSSDSGASLDLENFNVGAFMPRAVELAKKHYADAEFVRLDAMGMNSKGIVNFTAQSSSSVIYRFRSPAKSKPPPEFPQNAEFESNCMVYVLVGQSGVSSYILDKWSCEMPIVRVPKCTPEQIWAEAEKQGAPQGNLIGNVFYAASDKGPARWHLSIPPNFSAFVPDAC